VGSGSLERRKATTCPPPKPFPTSRPTEDAAVVRFVTEVLYPGAVAEGA
jgi:hypothetical protein